MKCYLSLSVFVRLCLYLSVGTGGICMIYMFASYRAPYRDNKIMLEKNQEGGNIRESSNMLLLHKQIF